MILSLSKRIEDLEHRVNNILRIATVESVNDSEGLVTVKSGENVTIENIPYLTQKAGEDKVYWLPSVNETGMLFSPSGDIGNSLFLPAFYTTKNPSPDNNSNLVKRYIGENITEEIDKNANVYKLQVVDSKREITETEISDEIGDSEIKIENGTIEITTGNETIQIANGSISITANSISISGDVTISGSTSAAGGLAITGALTWNGVAPTTW